MAVIGAGAVIGERASIGAGTVIGAGASIGEETVLHARVVVYDHCIVGPRCIVHSGVVIGADGFGMAEEGGRWLKIPQVGRVVIGADVEIGANTTIDRGALDDTVIEDDVKLDNQIQIGHNCRIGRHTAIAGCVGIAGSTRIGSNCKIGGAAFINGHIDICDGVMLGGGTGIYRSITEPGLYSGANLPLPHAEWQRVQLVHLQVAGAAAPVAPTRARCRRQGGRSGRRGRNVMSADDGRMDIDEIMRYLPHRYPFLMIDRVTSIEPGKVIRGIKNVSVNEPYFPGHFPEYAVMPAVLVIEALAQLASILAWKIRVECPATAR
jgi:acyl-[acyl carrier protein]--UDP-N-acetylglucosamine O-acyltransferase